MNIHSILLTVQGITVSVLFVEILVVFMRCKNTIHSYLLLACIASFISNLGYLFQMNAKTEEAYITALKLSYAGRVWIVLAFFLFSAKMCRIRIPKSILFVIICLHVGVYISVLTIGINNLYYSSYRYIADPMFPRFSHGNGSVHDLFMSLNAVLVSFAFFWVARDYLTEKNRMSKQRILMLVMAFGIQILFFFMQLTGAFGFTDYYDLTMPGALLGTVFMLIGILKFDLLGTREIAKDFAIDRISEGVIAVDNDGRIQYFNEPVAAIYPQFDTFYSAKSLLAQKPGVLIKKDSYAVRDDTGRLRQLYTPYDVLSMIQSAVRNGKTLNVADRIYTPEENDLMYNGECYGKLYALVDDTEHYRYMEELQDKKEVADRANEAKSRFLASMSHEIRTPINAVLGMDEMILRESNEKNIRAYAADIKSAGQTLLSLINDILDLSKVEEGKMEIIPVSYDLSILINDLVNIIRGRAVKKGLKFTVQADEGIPRMLIGDEIRIRQCAMNLLTNAVKYTEKGEVKLKISYNKEDSDHILLHFSVSDTGIGMKEEDMENLFSPYKRIEEKRNRTIEGTGLGMSITRQLLELMGGSLNVHSEYGVGSEFSFKICQEVSRWEELGDYAARLDELSQSAYEYRELFHAPDARILVVDDTEMNLVVIKGLLKKTEIHIDTALSGKEAIKLAADTHYDVIFIDHMMPDMDGVETLSNIRKEGKSCKSPAVALTANAVSGAREMYLEAGFTDYLSKPVDGLRLEEMLLKLLPAEKVTKPETAGPDCEMQPDEDLEAGKTSDFLARLTGISEIDEKSGLHNCGSEDTYRSVLEVFCRTIPSKADEIEGYYNSGDLQNYTIKVHALKSSARMIGAAALSELAKELEDAGKRSDTKVIQGNTQRLLEMYRGLGGKLMWLEQTDEDLPEIPDTDLKEAYQTILEIAGSMDYGLMEDLLKELRGYRLSSKGRDRISNIERKLTELDWDGIIAEVKEES
ncbi:MAG: response regulator [Butyrivibrio sp.]|nr:response regulator [Butyrivibrio sp.]